MNPTPLAVFALGDEHAAKADPALIAVDERHFAAIAATLDHAVSALEAQLDEQRRMPVRAGQAAMDRDQEVHRLGARLQVLRRYSLDLCLGRFVREGDDEPTYVGRLGLADTDGRRLLVDWRTPAAEPFFAATHAHPMGLASRRRYRWTRGQITDYWDEAYTDDALATAVSLDDQSAFVASLGASRSPRMRDVLSTIQSDQDAIIRSGSRGTLVVDGGPGTGKTVVALHRAAYLLYSDPHVDHRRGGVLFVGPHQPYLAYVADVLPNLGEEGVQTCTVTDLVAEGAAVGVEADPTVARLKSEARMIDMIEPAVGLYEEPPREGLLVETHWGDVWLDLADWREAFAAPDPGTPHNDARDVVWDALLDTALEKLMAVIPEGEASPAVVRAAIASNDALLDTIGATWPRIEAADLVGDLWTVPAYLRRCAPWLEPEEVRALQRPEPQAWTREDLPLLDAARRRLGDPDASRRRQRVRAEVEAQRAEMDDVVGHLIDSDDSEMHVMSMLKVSDAQSVIIDEAALDQESIDPLAGPFAHVVVDEAQELTDAEWQMLIDRCPSRSFTVVGDRAQARHGFTESWTERLSRLGLDRLEIASLTVNYRTPEEVMAQAAPVIRAALPDANVPTSIRATGTPVVRTSLSELDRLLDSWLAEHDDGTACVVSCSPLPVPDRVQSSTPETVKGLEFDLVVLIDPASYGEGVQGAVDRYVAMTRATQQLMILAG